MLPEQRHSLHITSLRVPGDRLCQRQQKEPLPAAGTNDPLPNHVLATWRVQVLCCEVDAVFSTLLEDGALCGALFALLDQPRPLDCMLAGYFARVLVCLLMRRSRDLLRYLKVGRESVQRCTQATVLARMR